MPTAAAYESRGWGGRTVRGRSSRLQLAVLVCAACTLMLLLLLTTQPMLPPTRPDVLGTPLQEAPAEVQPPPLVVFLYGVPRHLLWRIPGNNTNTLYEAPSAPPPPTPDRSASYASAPAVRPAPQPPAPRSRPPTPPYDRGAFDTLVDCFRDGYSGERDLFDFLTQGGFHSERRMPRPRFAFTQSEADAVGAVHNNTAQLFLPPPPMPVNGTRSFRGLMTLTKNMSHADFFYVPSMPVCAFHQQLVLKRTPAEEAMLVASEYQTRIQDWVAEQGGMQLDGGTRHVTAVSHDNKCMGAFAIVHSGPRAAYPNMFMATAIGVGPYGIAAPNGAEPSSLTRSPQRAADIKGILASGCYAPRHDVVIPSRWANYYTFNHMLATAHPWQDRPVLFTFRGSSLQNTDELYTWGLRQALSRLYPTTGPGSDSTTVFAVGHTPKADYMNELLTAKFCLYVHGWAPWSARLATIIHMGCIPVIISDSVVMPFENQLDWRQFSVKVAEREARQPGELKRRLAAISDGEARQILLALDEARHALTFHKPPQEGDAYSLVLMELARATAASAGRSRPSHGAAPVHRPLAYAAYP